MEKTVCKNCGAEVSGGVCRYCGSVARTLQTPEEESAAIDELHDAISLSGDVAHKARLLENGPLPSDPEVLVHAGLRCAQLLEPSKYTDEAVKAAKRRTEVIVLKLRLSGQEAFGAAIEGLENQIAQFERGVAQESRTGGRVIAFGCLLPLAIAAALAAWWYLAR